MTKKHTTPAAVTADGLLQEIGQARVVLADVRRQKAAAMEQAAAPYEPPEQARESELAALESELAALMKKHRGMLWPLAEESETLALAHGTLRRAIARPVVRVKKMVEKLKTACRRDLIRVEEKADWDKIEALSDGDLETIGTRRQEKEIYDYDTTSG